MIKVGKKISLSVQMIAETTKGYTDIFNLVLEKTVPEINVSWVNYTWPATSDLHRFTQTASLTKWLM